MANGHSISAAAELYQVPKTTLFRKVKGQSEVGVRKGPSTVLSKDEEQYFIKWIIYNATHGAPVTKRKLTLSVEKYVTSHRKKNAI